MITDGNGNDTIHGDAGNDEIFGLYGNDLIYGDAGNDKLWGQSENDTIYGGDGNDRIGGGSGEDHLYGDAGNDVISGTGGRDWLTGGAGNDRFDWDNVTKSAPGAANRDVIVDFFGAGAKGGDVIDLSTIDANSGVGGNQAFIFGGTGAGHVHAVASGARQPDPGRHRRRRRAGAGNPGERRPGQPLDRRRLHLVAAKSGLPRAALRSRSQ